MASLSRSVYDMPGLAPRILRATRHSNKLLEQGYVKLVMVIEEILWSIRGSYQTIRSYSLTNAKWHAVALPSTMTTVHRSDVILIRDLFTELDLLLTYERFPLTICDGRSMLTGDAYSSWHLVPSHLGLAYVLLVENNPFPNLSYFFRTIHFEHSSVLLNFASFKSKGPRSSLCTQVPCLAVKKWNQSIITESNIFCKCIIPIIRKEYALLLLTTTLMKNGKKRSYFCA